MGFFSQLFGSTGGERAEAARLGMTVTTVTRDCPFFSRTHELVSLKQQSCIRYSIPRRKRGAPNWSLLQRSKETGATLPNDYQLITTAPLSQALEEQLRRIAGKYQEEFFEFEGTADEVAVYWEEFGGTKQVQSLHADLQSLASS